MKGPVIHNEGQNAMENSQIKKKVQIALKYKVKRKLQYIGSQKLKCIQSTKYIPASL